MYTFLPLLGIASFV